MKYDVYRAHREAKGYTDKEVAYLSGCDPRAFMHTVAGEPCASLHKALCISATLGTTVRTLFFVRHTRKAISDGQV